MKPVPLRAHHLLCALGFRGRGYDAAFTVRMAACVGLLRDESPLLRLTAGVDVVCRSCPHRKGNACRHNTEAEERISERDRAILQRLGWREDSVVPAAEARRRVRERVSERELAAWCAGCSWYPAGWCRAGLVALRHDPRF